MSLLPQIFNSKLGKLLSSPGDKFSAEITKTGRQVVKITTDEIRRSAVRYPNTGTVVETIVHKIKCDNMNRSNPRFSGDIFGDRGLFFSGLFLRVNVFLFFLRVMPKVLLYISHFLLESFCVVFC